MNQWVFSSWLEITVDVVIIIVVVVCVLLIADTDDHISYRPVWSLAD